VRSLLKYSILVTAILSGSLFAQAPSEENSEEIKQPSKGRHGFIIGVGVGPGYTSVSQTLDFGLTEASDDIGKFAINTDFKIGFAINQQMLIYWNAKVAWFQSKVYSYYYDWNSGDIFEDSEDETFISSIGGVGMSYYFRPSLPSPYVTATIGYASFGAAFNDDYDAEMGFGMAAGAGFEFAPHWTAEAVVCYGHSSDEPLSTNATSIKALISVLSF
jgi:opacity protein-like surface antigen